MNDTGDTFSNTHSVYNDEEFERGYAFEIGKGVVQDFKQAEIHYLNSKSPISNYRLGCLLENGSLGSPDGRGAFRRMKKAADSGYLPARLKLADYHVEGVGVEPDAVSALIQYMDLYHDCTEDNVHEQILAKIRAVPDMFDEGTPMREFLLGLTCEGMLTDMMFKDALYHYGNAGRMGETEAQFRAGVLNEVKSPPDIKAAIGCYKASFQNGHVRSSMRLGILCFMGKGLDRNPQLAFKFFNRAAEGGDPYGQFWAAIMLQYGIGTDKDGPTALKYYESADKAGMHEAAFWSGLLLRNGADDVTKNVLHAHRLFKKASDQGIGRAMYELGRMYEEGAGVKADKPTACKYYGMADRNGCAIVNGIAEPIDPQSYLEGSVRSNASIYLQTLSSFESCTGPYEDEKVPADAEDVDEDELESGIPEIQERPHEVLERLNESMNKGGLEAKDARDEALFLFNSCFGLDTDFDRMYKLYIVALQDHNLGDIQFRIAQMMSDTDSPIHDENGALKWYEKAFDSGKKESAICIGDYYLDKNPSSSQDLKTAAS